MSVLWKFGWMQLVTDTALGILNCCLLPKNQNLPLSFMIAQHKNNDNNFNTTELSFSLHIYTHTFDASVPEYLNTTIL